ncbi:uncharacterized protein L969DRAFT_94495 [Mixia osmundae IAM 14324]|uniref:RING-type domain-containing protein n=1 Tax=Mixia osmundae (strain CBS 9802 / IAM 14324 / JCM 22182 / KY 12970) TaxID=764103 RepID=G7E3N8_MIXOS|nr:uncharacterized protein L969DRAFT_94495 [Mixia osmundae IAM 14324]KEI39431.1 hypothetical protein L969DRAFT_94495 [Mixia osmundae IAM 14324]GAA97448.1 hypothetical protein E5Q_04127 [Mixia osmundae IAM 14324]
MARLGAPPPLSREPSSKAVSSLPAARESQRTLVPDGTKSSNRPRSRSTSKAKEAKKPALATVDWAFDPAQGKWIEKPPALPAKDQRLSTGSAETLFIQAERKQESPVFVIPSPSSPAFVPASDRHPPVQPAYDPDQLPPLPLKVVSTSGVLEDDDDEHLPTESDLSDRLPFFLASHSLRRSSTDQGPRYLAPAIQLQPAPGYTAKNIQRSSSHTGQLRGNGRKMGMSRSAHHTPPGSPLHDRLSAQSSPLSPSSSSHSRLLTPRSFFSKFHKSPKTPQGEDGFAPGFIMQQSLSTRSGQDARSMSRSTTANSMWGQSADPAEELSPRRGDSRDVFGNASPILSRSQPMSPALSSKSKSSGHPDSSESEICPVCIESLSLKLSTERHHITPRCGHSLHEACFEAVYGDVAHARQTNASIGLCGVCRRDMKLGDASEDVEGIKDKFAAISGLPDQSPRADPTTSLLKKALNSTVDSSRSDLHNPDDDDPVPARHGLGLVTSLTHRYVPTLQQQEGLSVAIISRAAMSTCTPKITLKPEDKTITRSASTTERAHLTCMVTIEMPTLKAVPGLASPEQSNDAIQNRPSPPSSVSDGSGCSSSQTDYASTAASSVQASPPPRASKIRTEISPAVLQKVVADLVARSDDWKGQSPLELGPLRLYEPIEVRKEGMGRPFLLYLFRDALLCLSEESLPSNAAPDALPALSLKGRIYLKHIDNVTVTSSKADGPSLTIHMSDEAMDRFRMSFRESATMQQWRQELEDLVSKLNAPPPLPDAPVPSGPMPTRPTRSSVRTSVAPSLSIPRTSPALSENAMSPRPHPFSDKQNIAEMRPNGLNGSASLLDVATHQTLLQADPTELPPLDLMMIVSVPAQGATTSLAAATAALKLKILRNCLRFVVDTAGPRARLSIVTYTAGEGARGCLHKCPYIATGTESGRTKMLDFIDRIGKEDPETSAQVYQRDEHVNVGAAVNLALDVVMQRQVKSPHSGIILINDGTDIAIGPQMDLALARTEAASLPIHTLGWGKSHEPTSLYLLSNSTGGSYTFVQDWYGLQDCVAGCVGSMLSVVASRVRLHLGVSASDFVIRKVAGISGAIVSADGKHVDVELSELRTGEKRDLLVELDLQGGIEEPVAPQQGVTTYTHLPRSSSMNHLNSHIEPLSTGTSRFLMKRGGMTLGALEDLDVGIIPSGPLNMQVSQEIPVFEANITWIAPGSEPSTVHRSIRPELLTISVVSARANTPSPSPGLETCDPSIVRRRMELLTADMMTRCLLLMARRSTAQAHRLLAETKRIITTILANLAPLTTSGTTGDAQRSREYYFTHDVLLACLDDIEYLLNGVRSDNTFQRVERHYGTQNAMILRDQRSCSPRSATERAYWTADYAQWLLQRSQKFCHSWAKANIGLPLSSMDLQGLNDNLPREDRRRTQQLQRLNGSFKAAAQSLTALYQHAQAIQKASYQSGYIAALYDVQDHLQRGLDVHGPETALARIIDYIEARQEALRSESDGDDADEPPRSPTVRVAPTLSLTRPMASRPNMQPPTETSDTIRARRARTEAERAAARQNFAQPVADIARSPSPAAMRAEHHPEPSSSAPSSPAQHQRRSIRPANDSEGYFRLGASSSTQPGNVSAAVTASPHAAPIRSQPKRTMRSGAGSKPRDSTGSHGLPEGSSVPEARKRRWADPAALPAFIGITGVEQQGGDVPARPILNASQTSESSLDRCVESSALEDRPAAMIIDDEDRPRKTRRRTDTPVSNPANLSTEIL